MKYEDYYEPDQPYIHFQENPAPKEKKSQGYGLKITALLLILLLSAGAGFGGGLAALYYGQDLLPSRGGTARFKLREVTLSIRQKPLRKKSFPLWLGSAPHQGLLIRAGSEPSRASSQGSGTGIIVDEQGYILTNSHVVGERKSKKKSSCSFMMGGK